MQPDTSRPICTTTLHLEQARRLWDPYKSSRLPETIMEVEGVAPLEDDFYLPRGATVHVTMIVAGRVNQVVGSTWTSTKSHLRLFQPRAHETGSSPHPPRLWHRKGSWPRQIDALEGLPLEGWPRTTHNSILWGISGLGTEMATSLVGRVRRPHGVVVTASLRLRARVYITSSYISRSLCVFNCLQLAWRPIHVAE